MLCQSQEVLFSYNTIKIFGKTPSKPDTSRQNPESSSTHTTADAVGIFKKIFLCHLHLISFLLFFFQNNLRQSVCAIRYRKLDTFGNDVLPQNTVSILGKKKEETSGNYEFTTGATVCMHCWKWCMKFYYKFCIYIHEVIMPTLNLLLDLPYVNTVWRSCSRFHPVKGQFFLLLLPENACSGIQICFSAYRHS